MARADRRTQLVDTAERVFVQLGVTAASMDDLAEAAGVTKPVLYDHFGSKDGLLAAVVGRLGDQMLEATAGAALGASAPEEQLRLGLLAYFQFVDRHAGAWLLLLREIAPGSLAAAEAARVRSAQVEAIAALIGVHLSRDRARADVYAHIVSGAAERLGDVRLTGKRLSANRAAALAMDVLWSGFGHQLTKETP